MMFVYLARYNLLPSSLFPPRIFSVSSLQLVQLDQYAIRFSRTQNDGSPAPLPKSLLGRHRILAPTAAVHVSPICLGAMNFGIAWTGMMGECSQETAFEMLDYFYEMGGNFIDTANGYQAEQSETWLGEWMAKAHGRRDEMVIATKYTTGFKNLSEPERLQSNFGGNSAKSLHVSVAHSLTKLQTTYIDLLYVHYWDLTASVPEVMQSLNHLVARGTVLYLGVSDTPAWVVVKCNDYARQHGLAQFSVYQGRWSAAERDFERDILPMCMDQGMSLAPWGALGGGYFKAKEHVHKDGGRKMPSVRSGAAKEADVAEKLEIVAKRKGTLITSVALAYVMHKSPWVFPICGGRKVEHLKGNIEALGLELSEEDIREIETGYDFDVGFPMNFLGGGKNGARGPSEIIMSRRLGHFDYVEQPRPIKPIVVTAETVRNQHL